MMKGKHLGVESGDSYVCNFDRKMMQRQFGGGTIKLQETSLKTGAGEREPHLLSQFIGYLNKNKLSNLMANVNNYYGKNFPIKYQKKYNFNERWEGQVYEPLHEDFILQDATSPYSLLCLAALILNTLTIWVLSVERYFGTRDLSHDTYLFQIVCVLKVIEIWAKCAIRLQREERRCIAFQVLFRLIYQEVACLLYLLYMWIGDPTGHPLEYGIELLIYWLLWKAAASIYQRFKVMQFALKYESHVKIFDLLFNIFIQAHVFAIIMYSASKIDQFNNWTTATGIVNSPIMKQYIYSFYFACTTMLTIGYGDITPKNQGEVMVVVLIEIVGVVSFGYLLNEMGHTLSRMRQERQALDKDLQTIGKMAKYYNLEKSLESRAKGYLLNNQATVDQLKPDEQNKLLMKLNDQLRTEITNQNSLTILKSCIFFLCHWSKGFQAEIAKRLEKRLFSPNERLGQISGSERLYIVKQGKVCVYMSRFGSNQDQRKLLRVIHIESDAGVSNNIYGYTVAFSNRPVRLEAVASEFSSTYSISKEHFMQCVNLEKKDFEYYHQIKCRIDQAAFCEEWEAPSIKNVREHYIPSRTFLIKKYRRQLDNELNHRVVTIKRRKYKKYALIHDLIIKNAECINPYSSYTMGQKTLEFALKEPSQGKDEQIQIRQSMMSSSGEKVSSSSEQYSNEESYDETTNERSLQLAKEFIRYRMATSALDENDNKKIIAYIFEGRRDYCNFFPKNNLPKVLLQLEKENYYERRLQQIPTS